MAKTACGDGRRSSLSIGPSLLRPVAGAQRGALEQVGRRAPPVSPRADGRRIAQIRRDSNGEGSVWRACRARDAAIERAWR